MLVLLIISIILFVYLGYALLNPEKFWLEGTLNGFYSNINSFNSLYTTDNSSRKIYL